MKEKPEIKEKRYYNIREVAQISGVKPHVLRYWETEFPMLRPVKDRAGRRLYRKSDLELVLTIKKLLYEENYTIKGARKRLSELNAKHQPKKRDKKIERLEAVKEKVKSLMGQLQRNISSLESCVG